LSPGIDSNVLDVRQAFAVRSRIAYRVLRFDMDRYVGIEWFWKVPLM